MNRFSKRTIAIGAIVVAIPALLIGWWLLSPLFLDTEVNEEFPSSSSAQVSENPTQDDVEESMEDVTNASGPETKEPLSAEEPTLLPLARGEFQDADEFHQGSGTATIYQLEDRSRVLRLENFEVTNGPDLRVLLSSGANPANSDELGDYIELGGLKGNIGDQNYEIPDDADLNLYSSVVIYCKPFHVVFSVAPLDLT